MKNRSLPFAALAGALAFALPAAAYSQKTTPTSAEALATTYADIAFQTYSDAANAAAVLKEAAATLKREPNALSLAFARLSWVEARTPFMQAEILRFAGGPVDADVEAINGRANPGFIDGDAASLMVDAAAFPVLDAELLASLKGKGATGFHGLEFLLWGAGENSDAGTRAFTDFLADDPIGARRAEYVLVCAGLLSDHLESLTAAWSPDKPGNYRQSFLKLPAEAVLARLLGSVSTLAGSELAEKRLGGPLASKDGSTAESPFSNLTHLDILHASAGIANVMAGAYLGTDQTAGMRVRGTGLITVVEARDPKQSDALREAVNETILAARALESGFGAAVAAGDDDPKRVALVECARSLKALGAAAATAASALGVESDLAPE